MGKSPGKWIKTLLFGKKSSKSSTGRGREALKTANDKGLPVECGVDSSGILHSVPTSTEGCRFNVEQGKGQSNLSNSRLLQSEESQGLVDAAAEQYKEEQAAIRAQAAFRGYLARRAFRALRGIIRLQALVRGHLVRRQAVATLYGLHGIVKLQAVIRGRRVRCSDLGLEVCRKWSQEKTSEARALSKMASREKLSTNAFICKLLGPSPVPLPIRIQYTKVEANSAWNWLERWTKMGFWRPISQPKKATTDKKSQIKQSGDSAESGQAKRNFQKSLSPNTFSASTNIASENEKPKRNSRKASSSLVVEPVHDSPQSELEKVKRNLRKVSAAMVEAPSDRPESESEKPKRVLRKTLSSPTEDPDQAVGESAEKIKKDNTVALEKHIDVEPAALKPHEINEPHVVSNGDQPAPLLPSLQNGGTDHNLPLTNGELSSKEEPTSQENLKASKRRASLPVKGDENGLPSTPTLPSYMAATESAKAKLRGQGSLKFGSDGVEKNDGFTRRHSLPTSTNGKVSSPSTRAQKLVQATGKGSNRSARSLLSSRDGNEKVIIEWRR